MTQRSDTGEARTSGPQSPVKHSTIEPLRCLARQINPSLGSTREDPPDVTERLMTVTAAAAVTLLLLIHQNYPFQLKYKISHDVQGLH